MVVADAAIADSFFQKRKQVAIKSLTTTGNSPTASMIEAKQLSAAIDHAILQVLHPHQLPMTWRDLDWIFLQNGFVYQEKALTTRLGKLVDQGLVQKLRNPYNGNTFVFCSPFFKENVQVGDRVIELMRRRGSRIGTVVRFRTYRDRNRYPVVNWEYSVRTQKPLACQFESFANPETLVVIERPDPITQKVS